MQGISTRYRKEVSEGTMKELETVPRFTTGTTATACQLKRSQTLSLNFSSGPFLNQKQNIALYSWENGEDALAKSLIAIRIYKQLAKYAEEADYPVEEQKLEKLAELFSEKSYSLLDLCFKKNHIMGEHLLTYEMETFSRKTNLDLAYAARHYKFFEHPRVHALLQSLWHGGLRNSKFRDFSVYFSLICSLAMPWYSFCELSLCAKFHTLMGVLIVVLLVVVKGKNKVNFKTEV